MTESYFSKTLLKSTNGSARLEGETEKSPWNNFLNTLDKNPKISDSEAMALFAKTLSSAKSDWKDSKGNTLLMHMASRGKTAIVKRLIHELYADVRATNVDGNTALHMAARSGFKEVCEELMKQSAFPFKKNQNGDTPADLARNNGHADVAKLLQNRQTESTLWKAANTDAFNR